MISDVILHIHVIVAHNSFYFQINTGHKMPITGVNNMIMTSDNRLPNPVKYPGLYSRKKRMERSNQSQSG